MSRLTRLPLLLLLACCLGAQAGDEISIRLVEAVKEKQAADPKLKDILPLLQKSPVFSGYAGFILQDQKVTALPADGTVALTHDFTVACSGAQDKLAITVTRDKDNLLSSTVQLRDGKPLILGGFTSKTGKLFLILLSQ